MLGVGNDLVLYDRPTDVDPVELGICYPMVTSNIRHVEH